MLYAIGFLVTFLFGGITGIILASPPLNFAVTDSYFVVAHFHYVLAGTVLFAMFAGFYFWWPKMTGERVSEEDPWGYCSSLEWVTTCPPPRHNFYRIPRIRSERPAFEAHYPHIKTGRASYELAQTIPPSAGDRAAGGQP